jgi:DNA-binding protein
MPRTRILPLAAMDKLMRKAGASRVSESAKEELAKVLEENAITISKEAISLSKHAGRKTLVAADIELASKKNKGD